MVDYPIMIDDTEIRVVAIGKISDKEFIFKMEAFSEQSNGINA